MLEKAVKMGFSICWHDWIQKRKNGYIYLECTKCGKKKYLGMYIG